MRIDRRCTCGGAPREAEVGRAGRKGAQCSRSMTIAFSSAGEQGTEEGRRQTSTPCWRSSISVMMSPSSSRSVRVALCMSNRSCDAAFATSSCSLKRYWTVIGQAYKNVHSLGSVDGFETFLQLSNDDRQGFSVRIHAYKSAG